MPVAVGVRRREPERVLRERGRDDWCPTGARQGRGILERTGDLAVRALRRKREVAGTVERIRDDQGESPVSRRRSTADTPW